MVYSPTFPRRAAAEVFWSHTAAQDHTLQIYADQTLLLDALEGFASSGLRAGEGLILIATGPHRLALDGRLRRRGFDLDQARADNLYLPLDAAGTLAQFMPRGRLDAGRFIAQARALVARARGPAQSPRHVRAFGEMVSLLWDQGQWDATFALEQLWNQVCAEESLWLFCAYPRQSFAAAPEHLAGICAQHGRTFPT